MAIRKLILEQGRTHEFPALTSIDKVTGLADIRKTTTNRNPAVNGICERMHQTVGNVLKTLIHTEPPGTSNDAKQQIDKALATASHAVRTNVSQAK